MEKNTLRKITDTFLDAFIIRNIVLVQAIGLCPIILIGTHLQYGVALSLCTGLVLLPLSFLMSIFGERIPAWLRAPLYTVAAAALLTAAGLVIERYVSAELYAALDMFIPLMAVNTLISYRAGAFAVNHDPALAVTDAAASTMGFGLVICIISSLREIFVFGTIWGIEVKIPGLLPEAALPYAAFIMLGLMAALLQWIKSLMSRGAKKA